VHLSLPGGAVVADSMTPFFLDRHAGVPLAAGAVGVGGRKWLLMRAHALYIVIGSIVAWSALATCSPHVLVGTWLPWLVLASAAVPLALSAGMTGALAGGQRVARLHTLLSRAPLARRWLRESGGSFVRADGHIEALTRRGGPRVQRATALYLAAWMVEALETLLLLRLVGAHVGPADALALEVGLSLVRSAALFAPAGLGVQDLGYLTFLSALGVPDAGAVGAAFVLLKRGKELAWVTAGYATMALLRGRSALSAPSTAA